MLDFWRVVALQLGEGRRVFFAQVVANSRHSPGTAGARLALMEGGSTLGTIGGGAMERDVLAAGRRALATEKPSPPRIQTLQHRRPTRGQTGATPGAHGVSPAPSGMICAGEQTNLYAVLTPEDQPWVAVLIDHLERDAPGCLVIDTDGFTVAEGGGPTDGSVHQLETSPEGGFRVRQDLLARRRVALFGGGHCSLALARTLGRLGYRVEVWEASTKEPETDLDRYVAALHRVEHFSQAAGQVRWPELTWAVVMTSDFPSDVAALEGALRRPFPFLGVMGSPAKLKEIRRQLLARGFGEDDLARLTAPVGLALGSHTPEEIAISVAAQILALRNGLGESL